MQEKMKYEILNSRDDLDEIKDESNKYRNYEKTLDWVMKNSKNIHNLAIMGPYGSGKSSIFKTYLKKHSEIKKINISLAQFKNNDKNKNSKINLEENIIKQIFYKVSSEKIKNSRFKRINIFNKLKEIRNISIGLIATAFFLLILIRFINPIKLDELYMHIFKIFLQYGMLRMLKESILLIAIIFCVIFLVRKYLFDKIELHLKLKMDKAELEINNKNENNNNYLDKNMDEIIYFFENNRYDMLVFEDLDRFDDIDIFTQLRKLNNLLNESEVIKYPIMFVYELKDDMFKENKDRVKFFDFIIPVIPIVNANNSYDILKKRLDYIDENYKNEFFDFLEDISLYIDDMRILNNICNEFYLYSNIIKIRNIQNCKELFTLIVYKNLNPVNFQNMQKNKGSITYIINNKKNLFEKFVEKNKNNKKNLESQSQDISINIQKEQIKLKKIICRTIKENGYTPNEKKIYFIINDKQYSLGEFVENVTIDKINNNIFGCYLDNYSEKHDLGTSIKFNSDFGNQVEMIEQLKKEENMINCKLSNIDFEKISLDFKKINKVSLSHLFKKYGLETFIEKNNYKELSLFEKNSLIQGYINENYQIYINMFYGKNYDDRDFILNVNSQVCLPYDYNIIDIERVIRKIDIDQFGTKYLLNIKLIKYLYKNMYIKDNIDRLDNFIEFISNNINDEYTLNFVNEFWKNSQEDDIEALNKFIDDCYSKNINLLEYFKKLKEYEFEDKLAYVISNCNKFIEKINSIEDLENAFRNIDNNNFILTLEEQKTLLIEINKINEKNINVKLSSFDFIQKENVELLNKEIINNNLYEININTVRYLLKIDNLIEDKNVIKFENILNIKNENVLKYINDNINTYIENVLLQQEEDIFETEDVMLKIINNSNITIENLGRTIKKVEMTISDVEQINNDKIFTIDILKMLFQNDKIKINWKNIIYYYQKNEYKIDDVLIKVINTYTDILKNKKIDEDNIYEEKVYNDFSNDLVLNDEISADVIESLDIIFKKLLFDQISKEKSLKLIEGKNINFNEDVFNNIKEYQNECLITYIEIYIGDILKMINIINLDEEDINKLILSNNITNANKIEVLRKLECSITLNKDSANKIVEILLKVRKRYKNAMKILYLVFDADISEKSKIDLLKKYFDDINSEKIVNLLKKMKNNYGDLVANNNNRPSFENNEFNNRLIDKARKFYSRIGNSRVDVNKNIIIVYKKNR